MKISIVGDSLSTFKDYIPENYSYFYPSGDVKSVEDTWWSLLLKRNNWELGINNSYSGSRVTNTYKLQPSWIAFSNEKRIYELNSDCIIIFGGTNDYGAILNPPTLLEFEKSYRLLLTNLRLKNPKATFFLCTPFKRQDLLTKHKRDFSLCDISKCIKRISKEQENCKIIDLFKFKIEKNRNIFIDGLHPNKEGMKILSNLIEKGIKQEK